VTQLRYLLDTDILVVIRRGRPAEVQARFDAQANDLILVSNNEREFRRIAGLKLENWMR
jgi:predicted nucleic acid-binding protein